MAKNSGMILLWRDKTVICFNKQPLLSKGKIVLTLVDDNYDVIVDDNGKPKTLLIDEGDWNEEGMTCQKLGYVN